MWIRLAVIAFALAFPSVAQAAFPGENGRIAYTRGVPSGQTDIYSAEPDGLAEIRITEDGQSDHAAFSPDGARLAYSSGDDIVVADQYGNDATLVLSTGQYVGGIDTTMDALVPGAVRERERTLWELGQIVLHWEGPDGDPTTVADNQPFAAQGVFVP